MDIAGPITAVIICIIIFALCGYCCKRKREGTVYGYGPTVTVSTQPVPHQQPYPGHGAPPHNAYGSPHPYPPMPQPAQPGFYPPVMGYPPNSGAPFMPVGTGPYPPGPVPGGAPYPPAGYPPQPGFQAQPPPYDVAVSMPPVQPPLQTEAYGKQAPYNPHYQN